MKAKEVTKCIGLCNGDTLLYQRVLRSMLKQNCPMTTENFKIVLDSLTK